MHVYVHAFETSAVCQLAPARSLSQTGCMGGTLNNINRAGYPNMWPELYQPDAMEGKRYTIMEASEIVRVYHHTAGLTSKGEIIVAGCDACNKNTLESAGDWWSTSPKSKVSLLRK